MKHNKQLEQQIAAALDDIEVVKWQEETDSEFTEEDPHLIQMNLSFLMSKVRRQRRRQNIGRIIGAAAAAIILFLLGGGILTFYLNDAARAGKSSLPLYEAAWLPDGVKLIKTEKTDSGEGYMKVYANINESITIILRVDNAANYTLPEGWEQEKYTTSSIGLEGKILEWYSPKENENISEAKEITYAKKEAKCFVLWYEEDQQTVLTVESTLTERETLDFIKNLARFD